MKAQAAQTFTALKTRSPEYVAMDTEHQSILRALMFGPDMPSAERLALFKRAMELSAKLEELFYQNA